MNCIVPGAIETNIWNVTNLSPEDAKKHKEGMTNFIPMGRFWTGEEVANVAFFLVSNEASLLLGLVISWMEEQEHLKKKIIGLNDLNNFVVKFYLNI